MAKYEFLLDSHETPMKFHKGEILEGTPDNVTKDSFVNFKRPDGTTFFAEDNFEVKKIFDYDSLLIGGGASAAIGLGIAYYKKMGILGYVLTTLSFAAAGTFLYSLAMSKEIDGEKVSNYVGGTGTQVVRQQVVQQSIREKQEQQHAKHKEVLKQVVAPSSNPKANCQTIHKRGGGVSYYCPPETKK